MHQCPLCGAGDSRFSRPHWAWETWRQHTSSGSFYRYIKDGWRGWASSLLTAARVLWRATLDGFSKLTPYFKTIWASVRMFVAYLMTLAAHRKTDRVAGATGPLVAAAAPAGLDELDFDALDVPPPHGRN